VQQTGLVAKARVDGVGRHTRVGGDGVHRRGRIPPLGEEFLGRVKDAQPGLAGLRLALNLVVAIDDAGAVRKRASRVAVGDRP